LPPAQLFFATTVLRHHSLLLFLPNDYPYETFFRLGVEPFGIRSR